MGRSKASHIRYLEKTAIARMRVCDIETADIIEHIRSRRQSGAGPSTANNDIIWLRVILRYARAAWGLPVELAIIDDAAEVLKAEKLIGKAEVSISASNGRRAGGVDRLLRKTRSAPVQYPDE